MIIRPETAADKSRVATLIARTYLDMGAEMISHAGRLRTNSIGLVAEIADTVAAYMLITPVENVGYMAIFALDNRLESFDGATFLSHATAAAKERGFSHFLIQSELNDFETLGFKEASEAGLTLNSGSELPFIAQSLTKDTASITLPEELL